MPLTQIDLSSFSHEIDYFEYKKKGYELIRTVCAQNPTLGHQIIEDLLRQRESYYQILGLYGITLLDSPTWEPHVLELAQHSNHEVKNSACVRLVSSEQNFLWVHLSRWRVRDITAHCGHWENF